MAQHRLMAEGEEGSASRRRAEGDRAAHYDRGAEQLQARPLGFPATLLGRTRLARRGNSGTHAQRLLNMQRTHGNRAVQRQADRTGSLETLKKYMGDGPGFEYIRKQMGMEPAQTHAQAVDDAKALDAAESAITGRPPLESAPPMVPVPVLTPDPHKDFPGEGALEYRNVSPQLNYDDIMWQLMQEHKPRGFAPSGMGGWRHTNISNPAGDLMSRRHWNDGMSVW